MVLYMGVLGCVLKNRSGEKAQVGNRHNFLVGQKFQSNRFLQIKTVENVQLEVRARRRVHDGRHRDGVQHVD